MSDPKPLPFIYQFISGAVAGVSEILVMYPLDVVKTRQQLATNSDYNGTINCLRKIVKEEGFSRLYKGISAPILMEAPKELLNSLPMMNGVNFTETCLMFQK